MSSNYDVERIAELFSDRVRELLCGDYPAPCNCDDPKTHDEEDVHAALRTALSGGPVTIDGQTFQRERADEYGVILVSLGSTDTYSTLAEAESASNHGPLQIVRIITVKV